MYAYADYYSCGAFLSRMQAGKYGEALELAKVALKWEEKELGGRPSRLAELYSLMAEIYDEVNIAWFR